MINEQMKSIRGGAWEGEEGRLCKYVTGKGRRGESIDVEGFHLP